MKKLISIILVLTLALVMSGCDDGYINDIHKECAEKGGTYIVTDYSCDYSNVDMSDYYYTQEELDEILSKLYDFYIEENEQDIDELEQKIRYLNERLYYWDSELRDFERFEYEDLIELMEYLNDNFEDDLIIWLDDNYLVFTEATWTEFIIEYSSILHEEYQVQIDLLEQRISELESGE